MEIIIVYLFAESLRDNVAIIFQLIAVYNKGPYHKSCQNLLGKIFFPTYYHTHTHTCMHTHTIVSTYIVPVTYCYFKKEIPKLSDLKKLTSHYSLGTSCLQSPMICSHMWVGLGPNQGLHEVYTHDVGRPNG